MKIAFSIIIFLLRQYTKYVYKSEETKAPESKLSLDSSDKGENGIWKLISEGEHMAIEILKWVSRFIWHVLQSPIGGIVVFLLGLYLAYHLAKELFEAFLAMPRQILSGMFNAIGQALGNFLVNSGKKLLIYGEKIVRWVLKKLWKAILEEAWDEVSDRSFQVGVKLWKALVSKFIHRK